MNAQYWQQEVDYTMKINFDAEKHQYEGTTELIYTNNSSESLDKVFFHLQPNAFQPGSMMDVRSRNIKDPDSRVGSRISQLQPSEQGFLHVENLKMNGQNCQAKEVETILEVTLPAAIKPGKKVTFTFNFKGQVPIQIRRSGRSNAEGVAYSMSQWYPKLAEFDEEGWHADPYVGREFYGVWGDFHVDITIDKAFVVGAGAVLLNPQETGHGYPIKKGKAKPVTGEKITWKFEAIQVHDFMWAADKDYQHDVLQIENGPELHFFYQNDSAIVDNWKSFQDEVAKGLLYMSENFGKYPYPVYSVIQGGDGGMEYPMGTLITGRRSFNSLLGVTMHELAHSWFHGVLATNESLHEWMDEGFGTYITTETMHYLKGGAGDASHLASYDSYISLALDGEEDPLSTHADHYRSNRAYGVAAYSKGETLLAQLGYVIGQENLKKGLLAYYDKWKFKHPRPVDFRRVMEQISGLELDWYFEYFVNSILTIDYEVSSVESNDSKTQITLHRKGEMPMPVETLVIYKDGNMELYYMPMVLMRGEKPLDDMGVKRELRADWPWTNPYYTFEISRPLSDIQKIVIDPFNGTADIDRLNNEMDLENKDVETIPGK
jgi:hypothetical protein